MKIDGCVLVLTENEIKYKMNLNQSNLDSDLNKILIPKLKLK